MKKNLVQLIIGIFLLIASAQGVNAQWKQLSLPFSGKVGGIEVIGKRILAATNGGGVMISTDSGTTWKASNTGLTNLNDFCFTMTGTRTYVGTSGGVFMSADSGATWNDISSGLPGIYINAIASTNGTVYAGTWYGIASYTNNATTWTTVRGGAYQSVGVNGNTLFGSVSEGGFDHSIDNGKTWSSWVPYHGCTIYAWVINGDSVFAGANTSIYLSTNNGTSWTETDSGMGPTVVRALVKNNSYLFAGTSSGVYMSTNDAHKWNWVDSKDLSTTVYSVVIVGNTVLAGTDLGVSKITISGLTSVNPVTEHQGSAHQTNFKIHPSSSHSNPNLSIEFSLPRADRVTVKMYNLSGHEISSLVNQYFGPGAHSISCNTPHVAAGYYTIRMLAGTITSEQSMILSR